MFIWPSTPTAPRLEPRWDSREAIAAPYTRVRCVTDVTIGASCHGRPERSRGRRGNSPHTPAAAMTDPAALDRYTALVAALLGVRTDYASTRFDAEVTAALTANRLDVATARTLRWWQRASVREVEGYANSVLPAVLATRSAADERASIESDESAASWQQAQAVLPAPAVLPDAAVLPGAAVVQPDDAIAPEVIAVPHEAAEPQQPSRVITIPDPATRRRSAKEIQQAVREALRATAPPLNPGQQDPGLPFDVPSLQNASSHGRDRGDHAHSAPIA